jgi:hypothetical protein
MKRFEVWLDKRAVGHAPATWIVEVNDNATEEEIESACREALESLIENELDTGWREI